MSGLDVLFETSIDYERTHQIALFTLLQKSDLAKYLINANIEQPKVIWEPVRQLFDLELESEFDKYFIELKMWASLSDNQFKRQSAYLEKENTKGIYVFLGTSWFEYDNKAFEVTFGGNCKRVGYEELIQALNMVLISANNTPEIGELTLAYRNAIAKQYNKIINAYRNQIRSRIFYYSLYNQFKIALSDIPSSIYGANNPGGEVSILNNNNWHKFNIEETEVYLFYELNNGILCFKFKAETNKFGEKESIRKFLRSIIEKIAGSRLNLRKSGKLGEFMTIFKVNHEFSNIELFNDSIKIFKLADDILHETTMEIAKLLDRKT